MCGIAGFVDRGGDLTEGTLRAMQSSLQHRGPDDRGLALEISDQTRIGLAHTRLSILDLSSAGQQPMRFLSLSIVFNGEIYNFRELRHELEALGHAFETECDTEVILHAFAQWGIDCLQRFIGMFAFALHDAAERKIYFVRDRAGVKPLYLHMGEAFWLFGSELKALRACPRFNARLSPSAVGAYFRYGYVPDDRCIYEGCAKVDAGTYWVLDTQTMNHQVVRWWDQTDLYDASPFRGRFEDAVDEVESLLRSACNYRMVADVPVGVFLSGGYDSTAVAAILQSEASGPIKTFTIGFTEGNDEAPAARAIARELGTEHHEFYCSPHEALAIVPALPEIYDEPFADSSAVPTTLVSKLAREHVAVALSADGGDELFGGYVSYPDTARRMNALKRIPLGIRQPLGRLMQWGAEVVPSGWHQLKHKTAGIADSFDRSDVVMAQRLHESARLMPQALIKQLMPSDQERGAISAGRDWPQGTHLLDACMGLDYQTYLKDDILTKVDRATMSVGLEGREPLLDHRLAELAVRLPMDYKIGEDGGKRVLKEIVHRHLPKCLMDRPKSGFSLPIMKWMRGELRELLSETCRQDALAAAGLFNTDVAGRWIDDFKRGRFHYQPLIWRLLIFQLWQSRWL